MTVGIDTASPVLWNHVARTCGLPSGATCATRAGMRETSKAPGDVGLEQAEVSLRQRGRIGHCHLAGVGGPVVSRAADGPAALHWPP